MKIKIAQDAGETFHGGIKFKILISTLQRGEKSHKESML